MIYASLAHDYGRCRNTILPLTMKKLTKYLEKEFQSQEQQVLFKENLSSPNLPDNTRELQTEPEYKGDARTMWTEKHSNRCVCCTVNVNHPLPLPCSFPIHSEESHARKKKTMTESEVQGVGQRGDQLGLRRSVIGMLPGQDSCFIRTEGRAVDTTRQTDGVMHKNAHPFLKQQTKTEH